MSIKYIWSLDSTMGNDKTGVIREANGRLTAVDSENPELTATEYAAFSRVLPEIDPKAKDFVQFKDVDDEVVLGWIRDDVGEEEIAKAKKRLADQIEAARETPPFKPLAVKRRVKEE